jgi:hypothetical protein
LIAVSHIGIERKRERSMAARFVIGGGGGLTHYGQTRIEMAALSARSGLI